MDKLPQEVILTIFKLTDDYNSVAALRLQGRRYAEIGAEFLITRIRFHTTEESLERLKFLGEHAGIAKPVDTITYEANLLGHRSRISYREHFKEGHHTRDLPEVPPEGSTPRAERLYKRNMEKYEKSITDDYEAYRAAYDGQKKLLNDNLYHDIAQTVASLPNLRNINFTIATRCPHSMSRRFQEAIPLTCNMPVDLCSKASVQQLQALILPKAKPLYGLQSLHVHGLSPRFFQKDTSQPLLEVFKSLKSLRLTFRLEEVQRHDLHYHGVAPNSAYKLLSNGYLHDALARAQDLNTLQLNFDDLGYFGPSIDLKSIFGTIVWPKLETLDIDCVKFNEVDLIEMLKRQPVLKDIVLAFAFLSDTTWASLVKAMNKAQKEKTLKLRSFETRGLLEDHVNCYSPSMIDATAYELDRIEVTLSDMVDDFVTANLGIWDDDEDFNPLDDIEWMEPDDLYETYGYPDSDMDLDDFPDDDDDEDGESDFDEQDLSASVQMPGLVSMDVD